MTKPRPCPFCGSEPIEQAFGNYHEGTESREICCTNPRCKVRPGIVLWQDEDQFDLVEAWNERHEAPNSTYIIHTAVIDDRTSHLPTIALPDESNEPPRDLGHFNCADEYRFPNSISEHYRYPEDECPGHVASDHHDPKICALCGVHIDSLRPPE